MLILNRGEQQKICIGDKIVLTVVSISRGRVRIGIEAPPEVIVYREEAKQRYLPVKV